MRLLILIKYRKIIKMDVLKSIKEIQEKAINEIEKNASKILKLSRLTPHVSKKPGASPGTLIYTGKPKTEKVKIQVMDYTRSKLEDFEAKNIQDVFKFKDKKSVTWINLTGIHETGLIAELGENFKLHPLLQEDIVNLNQRAKLEEYDNSIFLVIKMIYYDKTKKQIKIEQMSFVVGDGYVISFQEDEGDIFDIVRKRIRESMGKIRGLGSDYLVYALIDAIVDNYFLVLEKFGENIEHIEDELTEESNSQTLNNIYSLKRELILLRKSVWPLREVISSLQRNESKLVKDLTRNYIRDVYDHTIQVIDTIDSFRDMLSGIQDLSMNIASNKMNEIMKVLTIIATIFIPLTFIAGIYGMNFEYMPELQYKFAYPLLWMVMILVGFLMFLYFKKKDWV